MDLNADLDVLRRSSTKKLAFQKLAFQQNLALKEFHKIAEYQTFNLDRRLNRFSRWSPQGHGLAQWWGQDVTEDLATGTVPA